MSRSPKLGLSRRLKLLKQFITIFRLARPSHGHAVLQGADPNAARFRRPRQQKNSFENPHTSESEILSEIRSENATTKREWDGWDYERSKIERPIFSRWRWRRMQDCKKGEDRQLGSKDFDDAHREFDEEQIEMQEVMHACQWGGHGIISIFDDM